MDDVFVAKIACGGVCLSRFWNNSLFKIGFSLTAYKWNIKYHKGYMSEQNFFFQQDQYTNGEIAFHSHMS